MTKENKPVSEMIFRIERYPDGVAFKQHIDGKLTASSFQPSLADALASIYYLSAQAHNHIDGCKYSSEEIFKLELHWLRVVFQMIEQLKRDAEITEAQIKLHIANTGMVSEFGIEQVL